MYIKYPIDDGDQITAKIVWSQEANQEVENYIYSKQNFIDISGENIRTISKEAFQTFYVLTKNPGKGSRALKPSEIEYFTKLPVKEITFPWLMQTFGNLADTTQNPRETKFKSYSYNYDYTFTLTPSMSPLVKSDTETTLGRYIFNRVMVERLGFQTFIPYVNEVLVAGKMKKIDGMVSNALKDDIIDTKKMIEYIDVRDWFGLTMHSVVTTSFTPNTVKVPKEVKALRKKLFKENRAAIDAGDVKVMDKIAKELLDANIKAIGDDLGMDLYLSGARGSVGNHMKNMMLTRGAVLNAEGKYDIVEGGMFDGLQIKDIPANGNSIVQGAYSKSVNPQVSGYLLKQMVQANQAQFLADENTDCGSIKYIEVELVDGKTVKASDFLYRYIIEGGKLVLLTPENIDKYKGKTVKMRSVMYCTGIKNQNCMCSKCAGEFYYKLKTKNIGILSGKLGGTMSNVNMQKFHSNNVELIKIDVDDMIL